jgi:hypothetical protein
VSRLLDGPAGPIDLALRRAPIFLRVVVDRRSGKVDALDQLDDVPMPGEAVHVYEAVPGTTFAFRSDVFVCVRGPGGMRQAATALGDYRHRLDVDGESVRETDAWRAWCLAQPLAGQVEAGL